MQKNLTTLTADSTIKQVVKFIKKNINFLKCAPNNRCGHVPQSPTDDPVVMLLEHVIPVNRIIYL